MDELFRVLDVAIEGREVIDGRSAIVVAFSPRPGVKTSDKAGKILQKFAGRAWVDEEDISGRPRRGGAARHVLLWARDFCAPLQGGDGFVRPAKSQRRGLAPGEGPVPGHARLFLLKGLRIDSVSEYADYKKFEVATDERVEPEEASP